MFDNIDGTLLLRDGFYENSLYYFVYISSYFLLMFHLFYLSAKTGFI